MDTDKHTLNEACRNSKLTLEVQKLNTTLPVYWEVLMGPPYVCRMGGNKRKEFIAVDDN